MIVIYPSQQTVTSTNDHVPRYSPLVVTFMGLLTLEARAATQNRLTALILAAGTFKPHPGISRVLDAMIVAAGAIGDLVLQAELRAARKTIGDDSQMYVLLALFADSSTTIDINLVAHDIQPAAARLSKTYPATLAKVRNAALLVTGNVLCTPWPSESSSAATEKALAAITRLHSLKPLHPVAVLTVAVAALNSRTMVAMLDDALRHA
jgi:hypothetical protein